MSITVAILSVLVVVLGATGTYLMLPHRHGAARPRMAHGAGAVLAGFGLLMFLSFWSPPGPLVPTVFFYVFSVAAIIGAILTISSRNPIYSALWFASVVLATAGLFVLAGAPFLAAGTVIVYAGAIIVTFLFVIMLAQMEGKAAYDRAARAPGAATFSCFLLLWCLIYALSALGKPPAELPQHAQQPGAAATGFTRGRELAGANQPGDARSSWPVLERSLPPGSLIQDRDSHDKPNVAGLGESLYTTHLVTVGLAGVLLFVALVGAVAITNPKQPVRPVRP
jgi:NADH-quinone oxidoreductase subunit J